MHEFLPTPEVQEAIASDLGSIMPRVILKYLKLYNKFKGPSIYHIPHQYSRKMPEKSEVVCF